eukprot:m51a1_g13900 hypothetical protein (211) ;mRNA; r:746929-747633
MHPRKKARGEVPLDAQSLVPLGRDAAGRVTDKQLLEMRQLQAQLHARAPPSPVTPSSSGASTPISTRSSGAVPLLVSAAVSPGGPRVRSASGGGGEARAGGGGGSGGGSAAGSRSSQSPAPGGCADPRLVAQVLAMGNLVEVADRAASPEARADVLQLALGAVLACDPAAEVLRAIFFGAAAVIKKYPPTVLGAYREAIALLRSQGTQTT